MALSLLTRPLRRLNADGALETLTAREPALGRPTILMARSLCRFERVRSPVGMARNAALAAARLHAVIRAPFSAPGSAIARRGGELAVWWWDQGAAAAALAAAGVAGPLRLRPEAAAQAAGEGWRILREPDGYEAQLWRDGVLAESTWRRTPFDAGAWRTLTRSHDPAPAARPPIWEPGSPYGRRFVERHDLAARGPALVIGALALSLLLSAFLAGRGAGHLRRDRLLQAQISAAGPVRSVRPQLAARAAALTQLASRVDAPGPLQNLAEARLRLEPFGLRVTGFDAQPDELTVSVPGSAVAGVDLLVQALEASPRFRDVRPTLDREAGRLSLRMSVRR